jgi:ADP-ribosylglycohydrolase
MTPTTGQNRTALLEERITGALVGAAVGDALGGPVEGYSPEQILERHGGRVHGVVGPWHGDAWRTARPVAPYHKGDGHVTDDTLMTHALVRVYAAVRDHLDAYAIADHLVRDLMTRPRWIPELEAEALPLQRIFLAEKWLVARLHYGHADPREAGVGNIVNCGAAMYMAPVGLVNAANPAGAYAEALDVAGAHQSSYGREAAGVFAAAVAAACAPGATPDSVVAACLSLAKDGTRTAIERVCETASAHSDFESALAPLRAAVAPYDTVGPDYRAPSLNARRPSRLHAIEELPVALGMLVVSGGDYRHAVLGAVNYGRDCDSIATMAGALCGALGTPVPQEWAKTVAEASRLDLWQPAAALTEVTREIFARDTDRRRAHERAFARLEVGPAAESGGPACSV